MVTLKKLTGKKKDIILNTILCRKRSSKNYIDNLVKNSTHIFKREMELILYSVC